MEARQPIEGNSKRLLNNVGDYLKSDSYMYAPLLAPSPQTSTSTTSPPKDIFLVSHLLVTFVGALPLSGGNLKFTWVVIILTVLGHIRLIGFDYIKE